MKILSISRNRKEKIYSQIIELIISSLTHNSIGFSIFMHILFLFFSIS